MNRTPNNGKALLIVGTFTSRQFKEHPSFYRSSYSQQSTFTHPSLSLYLLGYRSAYPQPKHKIWDVSLHPSEGKGRLNKASFPHPPAKILPFQPPPMPLFLIQGGTNRSSYSIASRNPLPYPRIRNDRSSMEALLFLMVLPLTTSSLKELPIHDNSGLPRISGGMGWNWLGERYYHLAVKSWRFEQGRYYRRINTFHLGRFSIEVGKRMP